MPGRLWYIPEQMSPVTFVIDSSNDHMLKLSGSRLYNTLPRAIGIEAEIADWGKLAEWREIKYNIGTDVSVKPSNKEMQIPPYIGDELTQVIYKTAKAMYMYGASVNSTCGFHVHVDGGDFSYYHIRKLLALWYKIEMDVYKFLVSPNRVRSIFCVPFHNKYKNLIETLYFSPIYCQLPAKHGRAHRLCHNCNAIKVKFAVQSILYSDTELPCEPYSIEDLLSCLKYWSRKRSNIRNEYRYFGLNLVSWLYRGSFEFRVKEGLINAEEMLNWTLFCGWVVQAATMLTDRQILAINGLIDFVKIKYNTIAGKDYYVLPESLRTWLHEKIKIIRDDDSESF